MGDVVSVDLPWLDTRPNRTAIAFRSASRIHMERVSGGEILADAIVRLADPDALVLLDVPIDGCSTLSRGQPYRPLDRRLLETGIPLLPSYKSGTYGATLRADLVARRPDLRVEESYPYAVMRVLWAVHKSGEAWSLNKNGSGTDLTGSWWSWPPKYKRARPLAKRREEMMRVAGVMRQSLEPAAAEIVRSPEGLGAGELSRIADEYDALLGLLAGIALQDGNPWSWRAEIPAHPGSIVTIADRSLRERFIGPSL